MASCLYALIFWFLHWLEGRLPQVQSLLRVEDFFQLVNIVDIVEDTPPETHRRSRAAKEPWDWLTYSFDRWTRIPAHYYEQVSSRLESLCNLVFIAPWPYGRLAFFSACGLCYHFSLAYFWSLLSM